jgi:hypothetical protein
MERVFALLALMALSWPALAADAGVSVQISQPGVYGRLDIGRFPQPQVVMAQPVIISRPVVAAQPVQPVYVWVPPGHRQNWSRHCHRYQVCGTPVYFVQDGWYEEHVMEGRAHGHKHKHGKGHGKHDD